MNERWSILDTRKYIEARFGCSQRDLVVPSINSLAERLSFSRYHHQEVQKLLDVFIEKHLIEKPLLLITHGNSETGREDFEVLMIAVGAHATACVLSIHAIADILAQVIYHSLGYSLGLKPLRERDISAATVTKLSSLHSLNETIAKTFTSFLNNPEFQHVAGLANKSKHQSIVRSLLNEDFTGLRTQRHEFRFSAFRYHNKNFPEVTFAALLDPAYELASRTIVSIGNMLNKELAQDAKK